MAGAAGCPGDPAVDPVRHGMPGGLRRLLRRPSISSPIPGMPAGKPAGVPCVQLTDDGRCGLFGHPDRPEVCRRFEPGADVCGGRRSEALERLARLERLTDPG